MTDETKAFVTVIAEPGEAGRKIAEAVAPAGTEIVQPARPQSEHEPIGKPVADFAPAPIAKDKAVQVGDIIDKWHAQFRGTVVAQNVEVWNTVYRATESLKQTIAAFIKEV